MSLIIGIDPGSRLTGYGIIQKEGQKLIFVDAGTIRTEAADMPERLKRIFAGIDRVAKGARAFGENQQMAVAFHFLAGAANHVERGIVGNVAGQP